MHIYYSSSSEDAAGIIASQLNAVSGEVLWLLSGGSVIPISVAAAHQVERPEMITVSLIDERFGAIGHPDSNWQQLVEAGFPFEAFSTQPVLNGQSIEETVDHYAEIVHTNKTVVALFGMGTDSHIAGILPRSLAAYESDAPVVGYDGPDHKRLTISPAFVPKIQHASLVTMSPAKHQPLNEFIGANDDPIDKPVELLKFIDNLAVITDMKQS